MSNEVLFLSHRMPFPPDRGDKIRSHHILKRIAGLAPVHVATFADDERDIAEEVLAARRVNNDRRITIYLSAKDKALALSRQVHGYPRLGSPYCFDPFEAADLKAKGVPVRCYASKSKYDVSPQKSGLAIVDTSDISRTSTGHSDYLNSAAACLDFAAVVNGKRDGAGGRVTGPMSHVFLLKPAPKGQELNDKDVCKVG